MSYFSEKIKNLRTEHELTQKQIANAIGISQGTYSGLESGKSDPSLDTLKAISAYYNEWIDSLVSPVRIVIDGEELTSKQWRLLQKYDRLSSSDQIEVECIMDMKIRNASENKDK